MSSPVSVRKRNVVPTERSKLSHGDGTGCQALVFLPITPDFAKFLLATPKDERHGRFFNLKGLYSGKPISPKRVSRIVSSIGEKTGVVVNKAAEKYASAHDLRRAFGTRWATKVKPATLKMLMRHQTIETTMKDYVDLDADDIASELWQMWRIQLRNG